MKFFKIYLIIAIVGAVDLLQAQGPSFYDLVFKADSVTSPYKTSSSNYAFVRSKRGTDGLNPTSSADSVKTFSISKIVLVYTESSPDDIANREEYNQERWENLIMTYPEFFQAKTIYQNMCQCSESASGEEFKTAQGFYVYYVPKGGAAAPKKTEPVVEKTESAPAKTEVVKTETPVKAEPVAETKKAEAPVTKTETPAAKVVEPEVKEEPKAEAPKQEVTKQSETTTEESPATVTVVKKKAAPAANKPKRSKDPKACRPACYGSGDDDLNAFFKDNITLSKKQKKKWKNDACDVKIPLNFDGSIKKVAVVGANADLNKLVLDAVNAMNTWNAAVKNGVAIKSEVRITLKFDKETKAFKPFTIVVNPRPNPKCKCMSDSEIFGD